LLPATPGLGDRIGCLELCQVLADGLAHPDGAAWVRRVRRIVPRRLRACPWRYPFASPTLVSARRSRSLTSRASGARASLSASASAASGSIAVMVLFPVSPAVYTTTLQGSSTPMSGSALSALCARGGLQAPRMA